MAARPMRATTGTTQLGKNDCNAQSANVNAAIAIEAGL